MTISIRHDHIPVREPYRGIFAHGVATPPGTRTLYISGQIGEAPDGHLPGDFRGQCRQALRNVEAVLREADMALSDIVKMTFYLIRRQDMQSLVEIRQELLNDVRPAITTLYVSGLVSPDWLIEVEAIACAE